MPIMWLSTRADSEYQSPRPNDLEPQAFHWTFLSYRYEEHAGADVEAADSPGDPDALEASTTLLHDQRADAGCGQTVVCASGSEGFADRAQLLSSMHAGNLVKGIPETGYYTINKMPHRRLRTPL